MPSDPVIIRSGSATAEIALLGAEARRWSVAGNELLWPGDPEIWNQISPILFPVVGATNKGVHIGGRHYDLGLHGFASGQVFSVDAVHDDFVRLILSDNAETRAVYPFTFHLAVEYRVSSDALVIAMEVENPGKEPVPYACGLHPGFRWPFGGGAREGARLVFEKDEVGDVPLMVDGGLYGALTRRIPISRHSLTLTDELVTQGAMCLVGLTSRSVRFEEANGAALEMDFHSYDHFALWSRPGAPFLCLEPRTSYADPEGFAGDLFDKPGMRTLEAGERARHEARCRFIPAG